MSSERIIRFVDALNEALREEMRRDDRVFVMGEDVGVFGGVYKVTRGLLEEFGPERVRDTPISEAGFTGAGIGAALVGMRPVVEIMYNDFMMIALNQLVNFAAKMRYLSGGQLKVPLVVRTMLGMGRGRGTGADHSQALIPWVANVAGLKVVAPSTPYDAKGLLKSAIRDDSPVIFFEAARLYPLRGPVPEEEYLIPIGKADVKREGSDVTVVAISTMVPKALSAAEKLAKEGIDVEVVDPRTVAPLDEETIIKSVKKTGKLITAEQSNMRCGVGAEIAAVVMEKALEYLEAPLMRIAVPNVPIPVSPPLEEAAVPDEDSIIKAVKKIVVSGEG